MEVSNGKMGEGMLRCWPPNEVVLTFWSFYVCANFGKNRSRNATVRVHTHRQIDQHTDTKQFYNLSHAACYSYGAENKTWWYKNCAIGHSELSKCNCSHVHKFTMTTYCNYRRAMAKLSKSRVWKNIPEEHSLIFWIYPNFLKIQHRVGQKSLHAKTRDQSANLFW